QVFRRIADQLQLGAHQQVGAFGFAAHVEHRRGIAREVADALVYLGKGDAQAVRHCPPIPIRLSLSKPCPYFWKGSPSTGSGRTGVYGFPIRSLKPSRRWGKAT